MVDIARSCLVWQGWQPVTTSQRASTGDWLGGGCRGRRAARWAAPSAAVLILAFACLAVPAARAAAAPAKTAPKWTIVKSPNPAATYEGEAELLSVSCSSSGACTAVGFYKRTGVGYLALTERWNGTKWKLQSIPNPTGGVWIRLYGVSCTSLTFCMAVGSFENSVGAILDLAEKWDGSSWGVVPTPDPGGTAESDHSELDGVSCTSPSACTAVGWFSNEDGLNLTLAERWSGTRWRSESPVNPQGSGPTSYWDELHAVSCTASKACVAVGQSGPGNSESYGTLAERWNGSGWSVLSTPVNVGEVADVSWAVMLAVSCTSTKACAAVGEHIDKAGNQVTLAETLNGTKWSADTTPSTPTLQELASVSCTSATACTAVGSPYFGGTLAEAWNGHTWALQATPSTGYSNSMLAGVACPSATNCVAVGSYVKGTLAESR